MNVYDFDKTVFLGESSSRFFLFCLKKHPKALLTLPGTGLFALFSALRLCSLTRFKAVFHRYLRFVPDAEALAEAFWRVHASDIPCWLPPLLPKGGLVISASPEFLIAPMCRRLGLRYLGTRMDVHTGRITGRNCRGEEKARRFRECYPDEPVDAFYSDSLADSPMAALSREAWLVHGHDLRPWPKETQSG